jgi:hypothetical protein
VGSEVNMQVKDVLPLMIKGNPCVWIEVVIKSAECEKAIEKKYYSGYIREAPYFVLDKEVKSIYAYSGNIQIEVAD